MLRTEDFDYFLPEELIAQTPLPRGESRLLVLHRADGRIEHRRFSDLPAYLSPHDTLVLNDSRVTARRLTALREGGQEAEAFLLRPHGERGWEALVRPGRRIHVGSTLALLRRDGTLVAAQVTAETPEGGRLLELPDTALRDSLASEGVAPLPPYIHTSLTDEERYQTVYAGKPGSAAAPTAGLHFTQEMLDTITAQGVTMAKVTLHVGIDTFRPVKVETLDQHVMHGESYLLSREAAERIERTQGRVVAVGTTVVRVLESAACAPHRVTPTGETLRETRLFITPGYTFQVVDALLTNFHLPKSTLLMLVSALAGREAIRAAYAAAVQEKYRFFSFGDAMLIL